MERTPRPVIDVAAQCACGAVRLKFAGTVLSMFMCSCEDCQKATGAGHSAIVLARPTDVTLEGVTRSFSRLANSGATLTRTFCSQCGTPLSAQSSRAPDVVMLPVGLFGADAADWYRPNQLIFARSHRDWDEIAADLPRHETYRNKGAMM
jgi:hypothetical protein